MNRQRTFSDVTLALILELQGQSNTFSMPWRSLLRLLSNNEELIRRLSESYPIRRAAQLTAYFFHAGRDKFIEQRGKYERAGGWEKTKRDMGSDVKGAQEIGKEYLSNLFRPYTDTWASYKDLRRKQDNAGPSPKATPTTKSTIPKKKPPS